jgi:SET domain-containing protein
MSYANPKKSRHTTLVKRSSAGLGLFAGNDMKKGDFVIEYYGPILNDDEAENTGGKYLFAINDKFTINGSVRENKARYLNHSCKPNCEPEHDGRRIYIYARKKIKAGDELTYDYGKEYFDAFIKPHGCRCGNH